MARRPPHPRPRLTAVLMVVALAVVVAAVPVRGGRLAELRHLHLRSSWLLVPALGLQVVAISVLPTALGDGQARAMHVASYALAGAFLVRNGGLPGMPAIVVGGAFNVAAIVANGGVMPALPEALELAGRDATEGFQNSAAVEGARLAFLGDVYATPSWAPLANVFSVGDALLLVGAATLLHRTCGARPVRLPRRQPVGG